MPEDDNILELKYEFSDTLTKKTWRRSVPAGRAPQCAMYLPADWCETEVIAVLHSADRADMGFTDAVFRTALRWHTTRGDFQGIINLPGAWTGQEVDVYKLKK